MAPCGVAAPVPVPRCPRARDQGRGEARPCGRACDPAGVEGRVDRAGATRKVAGDRNRRRGPYPVPLPPGIPCAPGAGEVRQADPLRRFAAGVTGGNERAHGARRPATRTGRGDRRTPDQSRLVSRRERSLCETVAHLRDHDAWQVARDRVEPGSPSSTGESTELWFAARSSTRSSRPQSAS
jgi:hypothetical protein